MDLTGLTEKKNRVGTRYFENDEGKIVAKECRKCQEIYSIRMFNKSKQGLGERGSWCKACHLNYRQENLKRIKEKKREYYETNRHEILERVRHYRNENRDKIREYKRSYRNVNFSKIQEYASEYYDQHQQVIRKRSRDHYWDNREGKLKYARHYQKENKELIRTRGIFYRQKNKELLAERKRQYYESNRAQFYLRNQRRRARKRALPDDLTEEQWQKTLDHFGGVCALSESEDISQEHLIPLDSGHGGTTFSNVYPLKGELNYSKGIRCIFDWFYENKERFNLEQRKFDELIEYLAEINGMTTQEYEEYVRWCHANPRSIDEIQTEETA